MKKNGSFVIQIFVYGLASARFFFLVLALEMNVESSFIFLSMKPWYSNGFFSVAHIHSDFVSLVLLFFVNQQINFGSVFSRCL